PSATTCGRSSSARTRSGSSSSMTDASGAYFDAWRAGGVDTMIGVPASPEQRKAEHYQKMNAGILDKEAREKFTFPAQYMFKDIPDYDDVAEPVEVLLAEIDRFNVARGMLNVSTNPIARE